MVVHAVEAWRHAVGKVRLGTRYGGVQIGDLGPKSRAQRPLISSKGPPREISAHTITI